MKQRAEPFILERKTVKDTAGEIVRKGNRNEEEMKTRKDPNLAPEQGGAAVRISTPSSPNYRLI